MSEVEKERSMGQSILYWAIVYAISLPCLFFVIGLVVRTTLTVFK